ncbi:MAG: hypothetical protein PVF40_02245, partial [Ectothiorhodospiraceae bacterium]
SWTEPNRKHVKQVGRDKRSVPGVPARRPPEMPETGLSALIPAYGVWAQRRSLISKAIWSSSLQSSVPQDGQSAAMPIIA